MKQTKSKLCSLALALVLCSCVGQRHESDVVVYGGTSAGVVAAYTAAQAGLRVTLVEPTEHIGGLTTGGLGYTDIGNKQVVTGVASQFYRKVGHHYGALEQWVFEPSVADSVMRAYLQHPRIQVVTGRRVVGVSKEGPRITRLQLQASTVPHAESSVGGRYFIDASYEGDLMALAGVEYVVGREASNRYGETWNGLHMLDGHQFPDGVDPYIVPGDSASGLLWGISPTPLGQTGMGDTLVQAYNYRICLTDSVENQLPITQPADYRPERYELLLRLMQAQPHKQRLNDYFIVSRMPGRKTDINNRGGFSSDMIGMNHRYPEASYAEREQILAEHTAYTQGLLYFLGHDPRVPQSVRNDMLALGYPRDEFERTGGWTPQLYVREARRMVGPYVATQADCQGQRTPDDGIAMAAYTMDSHNCQRIVVWRNGQAMVKNEGNVEVGGFPPYPVSYRSITPQRTQCQNLLVPVCLSASHIAFGSIRMEPVFMVLGQASGLAAALAIAHNECAVQEVDASAVRQWMARDPYMDGSQPDILVDNLSPGASATPAWHLVQQPGGYGPSFWELPPTASEERATFTATIPTEGRYTVYVYENVGRHLAPQILLHIHDASGVHAVRLQRDQIPISGQTQSTWARVGTFHFPARSEACVEYVSAETDRPLRADAVLFVKE